MTDPVYGALPESMEPSNTCCFTGHRNLPAARLPQIRGTLTHALRMLTHAGYRYFLCGGAVGFDMLAEETVVAMRETNPAIHLVLALPCRDQTGLWLRAEAGEDHLRRYQQLKGLASAVVYVNHFYSDGCMRERNRFMVEHASFCVAYYNGQFKSGAGMTWRMAKKAGLRCYNIYDILSAKSGDSAPLPPR